MQKNKELVDNVFLFPNKNIDFNPLSSPPLRSGDNEGSQYMGFLEHAGKLSQNNHTSPPPPAPAQPPLTYKAPLCGIPILFFTI